jgi:mRNA interferase YafQ
MILTVHYSNKFKKDLKRLQKSDEDMKRLRSLVKILEFNVKLPDKFRDHQLKGKYAHHRECHIKPDLLLIYKLEGEKLILVRTGSHSELFE